MLQQNFKRLLVLSFIVVGVVAQPTLAAVPWMTELGVAMDMAKNTNKLVLLEVSAPWCPACRKLEKLTKDKRVDQFLDPHFIKAKLSADSPQGQSIMHQYGLKGIPALLVFSQQGGVRGKMSGAPQDFEGFKHLVTNLAGGEEVVAAAGSSAPSGGTASGATQPVGYQTVGNFQQQGQPPQQYQQQPYQQPQMPYPPAQPQMGYQPQYPPVQQQQPMNFQQQQPYAQPGYAPQQQYPQMPPPQFGAAPQGSYPPQQQYPNYQQPQAPPAYGAQPYPGGQSGVYAPAPQGQYAYPPQGTAQPGFPQGYQQTQPAQGQFQYQPPPQNQPNQ